MKTQPKLITGAFAALLAALGTTYAAENSGGGKMNNVLKESNPLSRMAAPGGPHKCPDGTYWYEPAKACVPVGRHPVPRVQQPGAVGEAGGVLGGVLPGGASHPIEEKQSTNEICPPKCGPLGPSPTIPPAPQAAQARGDGPHLQNQPTPIRESEEATPDYGTAKKTPKGIKWCNCGGNLGSHMCPESWSCADCCEVIKKAFESRTLPPRDKDKPYAAKPVPRLSPTPKD
jgi:hypothetical protein